MVTISGLATQQCSFSCSGCVIALALPGCSSLNSRDARKGADSLGSCVLFLCPCHSPDLPQRQGRGQALARLSGEKELLGRSVVPREDPAASGVISGTHSSCNLAPGPGGPSRVWGWHGQALPVEPAASGCCRGPEGGCHLQWGAGGKWSSGAPFGHPFALQAAQKGAGEDLCPLGRCWPLTCSQERALSLLFCHASLAGPPHPAGDGDRRDGAGDQHERDRGTGGGPGQAGEGRGRPLSGSFPRRVGREEHQPARDPPQHQHRGHQHQSAQPVTVHTCSLSSLWGRSSLPGIPGIPRGESVPVAMALSGAAGCPLHPPSHGCPLPCSCSLCWAPAGWGSLLGAAVCPGDSVRRTCWSGDVAARGMGAE